MCIRDSDKQELIGINKNVSSKINMQLNENKIDTITFFKDVDGDIYPESELPENARKLRGFLWRGDERIKTKEEIFPPEELELDAQIQATSKKENLKNEEPLKIRKETLESVSYTHLDVYKRQLHGSDHHTIRCD